LQNASDQEAVEEQRQFNEEIHYTFSVPRYTSPSTILSDDFERLDIESMPVMREDSTSSLVLLSPPNRSVNPPIRPTENEFGTPVSSMLFRILFPLSFQSISFCFRLFFRLNFNSLLLGSITRRLSRAEVPHLLAQFPIGAELGLLSLSPPRAISRIR
jgi:hypothetical protein